MTRVFRPISAVCLALILSLTSVSMALARGDMAVNGTMILCLGGMQVTVAIGPDGDPVIEEHICPDCVVGTLALGGTPPQTPPAPAVLTVRAPLHDLSADAEQVQRPQARGPPAARA